VNRLRECFPRGVRQGLTTQRSGSTATRCNAVGRRAGRGPGDVAAFTRQASEHVSAMPWSGNGLPVARRLQPPEFVSQSEAL
jgi:hypothetical protein